uniref:PWWP domain-containing DNA repair factor 3A isoform X1 n=1 Tax=Myodes glareolus TaxID=447135 RepID=UPI002021585D|nr:PWWP domain-containing DNA repair factor 3A isoform X1 [Myodes glareolus]XP_048315948.1 PWWP domain-containing DNA repair factor 3A isoform X1 [Myodes glareolus]XP_048315952.1 PWWP domain-containing DNA repair factor 3A isoform X1 [Myodes glareolus]XP_048315959.1 PWWP domain-containing DNA repair factor 3A isoform X1 [Myodes glareolus]
MTDAKYVLCRWEKRLWPAKVLARTETSVKNKRKKEFFLDVQILSLKEKIQVKSSAVEVLQKSHIENIAAFLASQNEVAATPLEELTYRRSLRVALDILNERTSLSPESHVTEEKPHADAALWVPSARSPSFCSEDGDSVAAQCTPRREWLPQSLSGLSATEEDHRTGLTKNGTLRAALSSLTGDGSQDGSGSRLHCEQDTAKKRRRNLGEKPTRRRRTASCLSKGESVGESEGQANSCVTPDSPGLLAQASEEDPCAGVKGCDPVVPSGSSRLLPASDRGRGRSTKRPRLDGNQNPPARQLATGTVGAAPSPQNWPGENMVLLRSSDRDKPEEADPVSSEEFTGFKSIHSLLEEEEEEEEEPPRILLYHEPRSFEVGMLVWLKYQKYPFWPAVVKSVRRKDKKASVLFIEGNMNPKGRGITVSLRRLKHFDCKEKHALLDRAKEDFAQAIGWCVSLITDYRVRLGCGSFAGSFLEYYAADISAYKCSSPWGLPLVPERLILSLLLSLVHAPRCQCHPEQSSVTSAALRDALHPCQVGSCVPGYPVRKSIQQDVLGTRFPQLGRGDPEEPAGDSRPGQWRPCRKVLPDRSRAARDRANQKLVEYIVKAKGADSHLRAILHSRKPSRWLKTFLSSAQYVTCVETYLEDEAQLDEVVQYLQGICRDMDGEVPAHGSGDRIRFILDVLLPEAVICAISAVERVDYKTAEQKYIRGPTLSYREKEIFDNELLEERSRRRR